MINLFKKNLFIIFISLATPDSSASLSFLGFSAFRVFATFIPVDTLSWSYRRLSSLSDVNIIHHKGKHIDRNDKSQQWAGLFYKINSNKIKMIFAPSFPTCYLMLLPPPALIWNYVRGGPPCPFWFPSGFFWDTLYFYRLPKGEAFFITQQLENIQWEVEFPAQQESFW